MRKLTKRTSRKPGFGVYSSGGNDGRLDVVIDGVFRRKDVTEVPRSVLGDRVAGYYIWR